MCHYVTMVLPPGYDNSRVREVLGRYGRGFESLENRHVARLLLPEEVYFLPTPKHCDCGTALGSIPRVSADVPDYTRDIEKKRRSGWSEAKINRWLEQKRNHWQAEIERPTQNGAACDLDEWTAILRELRFEAGLGYVGILLHWYEGPLSERINAKRKELPYDGDMNSALRQIDEDVL